MNCLMEGNLQRMLMIDMILLSNLQNDMIHHVPHMFAQVVYYKEQHQMYLLALWMN